MGHPDPPPRGDTRADALGLGAAGAGEVEDTRLRLGHCPVRGRAARDGKAHAPSVRPGMAEVGPGAVSLPDRERVQPERPAPVVAVLFDGLDAHAKAGGQVEHGSHQFRRAQHSPIGQRDLELRSLDIHAGRARCGLGVGLRHQATQGHKRGDDGRGEPRHAARHVIRLDAHARLLLSVGSV